MAAARAGSEFGKYQLTRLLGQGGMGEVFEAHDTTKDRTVALKILPEQLSRDEGFRTRFQRESRAAAMLEEPHVIPIHDWGEIDGNLYIDMRLVRGQDLHELLKAGPLEPERAVGIIRQVASALDAAHAQGLIHRDVKPPNILITASEDFAYLIDFGIAENRSDTRLTVVGSAIGSFAYMAPERFEDRPTTAAVDTYSLAAVLYETLTGRPPFKAGSMEQVIAAHMSAPPPKPSTVNPRIPTAFDDVIARGLAKDPDDRYGSPGALGRAAQRALGGSPTSWPGTGPTAPTLAAPTRAPMTDPSGPTLAALNVPGHPDPIPQQVGGSQARPWLLPASIIAAAALILGGIGVVIGLLARPNSAPPTGAGSSNGHTIPAPSASQPTYHPEAPPISPTTPTVSPSSLTGRWSGPVSGDQSGFDVVAIIVDGGSLTATISYPQLNCGGTWTQRGFAGNGVRFVTEQITYGSCVTSEVTLAPQADGTLYFTSTYYAASKQRIFNTHAPLRRSTNE